MKRIIVIGGGSIGERHVRCFQQTGRATVSLCEVNNELREEIVARYELPQSFQRIEEALTQNFDAAVICTPAHLHVPMAMQFAANGTALLVEKPLAVDTAGIDELAASLKSRNVNFCMAYVLRHHPAVCAMKRAVDSERFGRPVQVVYTGGQHFPFYRPAYRNIYYARHESGGGAIQDALTHTVNAAEWIVGPVTRLVADADHCVLSGVDVEDTVHVMTRHESVLGSFSLNQHQPVSESALTVLCENGAVRYESQHSRWMSCREPDAPWNVEETFAVERDDLFVSQANAFLDQLDGRQPAVCTLDEGLQTLRVCLATLESARTGKWMEL